MVPTGASLQRPYFQFGIAQLRALFEARGYERAILAELREELSFRNTAGAKQLNVEVLQRIQELEASNHNVASEPPVDEVSGQRDL